MFVWYLRREDSRPHWGLCGMVQELNFPTGGIYTIKVIKQRDFAVLEYRVQTKFSKKFGFELHFKAKISLK